ncbi:NAD-specific glutamate dehydrogenase [compost metagenome]
MLQAGLQQRGSEVFAAEKVVAGGGVHFDQWQRVFQYRDVEGAAAQIEDQRAFEFLFMQPVSHRGGGRLVDQACHREPSQFGGKQRAFALFVAEVRRHGNHCFRNRVAEKGFGVLLE